MKSPEDISIIRSLFKPYQPSIYYGNNADVTYQELPPAEELSAHLYCYWQLKTTTPLSEPFHYRVVSDGCIDVLFESSKPLNIYATGFSKQYIEYDLGTSFNYFGIRFLPAAFTAITGIAAQKLTDQFLPLQEVHATLYESLQNQVLHSTKLEEFCASCNDLFYEWIQKKPTEIDQRFLKAMQLILSSRGQVQVAELADGISERQLRRLFNFYFGASPKTCIQIVRFQNILGSKPSTESLKHNRIFYDEGYYDQAHFIKEFKAFYGVTPMKAFGKI